MDGELIKMLDASPLATLIMAITIFVLFSIAIYFVRKTLDKIDSIENSIKELLADIRVMTNNMDATNQAMTNVHVRLESQATDLKDQQTQLNRHDVRIEILENIIEK
ncbi:MAG: hypothetical protein LBO69_05535 [Ignavibacteria bacterium]|jgi:uncharacterized protein YoxC|nr:hypothetical protein [Ignavibacteria bacterium]